MDMLLGSERGNSAWAEAEGPSGIVLQALFVLECVAPAELEASRFLPPTPILVNLDHQLKEVASAPEKLQAGDPHELLDHESMRRELLPSMIKAARKTAEEKMPAMIEMARSKMIEVLGTECQRLQALSEVNDHVRPEEVALARQQLEDLSGALGEARIRLDAIRVIRMKAGLNG
jgi:ATP-dependent helicase HepA